MIALSVKKNQVNFLSLYKDTSQLKFEDYGSIACKKTEFNQEIVAQIKSRKKIKKTQYPSTKCMIFLDTEEVVLSHFISPDEISVEKFVEWHMKTVFGSNGLHRYSDYHYEISDKNFLSLYVEKEKQFKYYSTCSKQNLKLSALSIGILSADYIARYGFDANSKKSYMIWGVGKDMDEILIFQNGVFQCLFTIKRNSKELSLINFIGSSGIVNKSLELLKEKIWDDLKSFNLVDQIYMYQKSPKSDIKKIYNKKNKDSIQILNPLVKMGNFKKNKVDIVETSYLAEMGYIFKIIDK